MTAGISRKFAGLIGRPLAGAAPGEVVLLVWIACDGTAEAVPYKDSVLDRLG